MSYYMSEWKRKYEILKEYVKKNGMFPSSKHKEKGVPLWWWMRWQRAVYASGGLIKEQIVLLEKLPGWSWNVNEDRWMRKFIELKNLGGRGKGDILWRWVWVQKNLYKQGKLLGYRVRLLESLEGWNWTIKEHGRSYFVNCLALFMSKVKGLLGY